MQIIVLADEGQKESLLINASSLTDVIWVTEANDFLLYKEAGAFIDLKYTNDDGNNALLTQLLPKTVIINSVISTLRETNNSFVRINGWNMFLSSPLIEATCTNEVSRQKAEEVFSVFDKKLEWLPDEPGFVTARVVSMIVNEAYVALAEGVSTKEEINTAMKLGTAYPFGPFEWAEKIGIKNIVTLLTKLSEVQPRYAPSTLLVAEAAKTL